MPTNKWNDIEKNVYLRPSNATLPTIRLQSNDLETCHVLVAASRPLVGIEALTRWIVKNERNRWDSACFSKGRIPK